LRSAAVGGIRQNANCLSVRPTRQRGR